jgi:succinoglycan biosynthesis protein ExoM
MLNPTQKIIVNICTFKRPKMLKACLDSILAQQLPENWQLEIQIIDNDKESVVESDVKNWASQARVPVRYYTEMKRGIPFARNAACEQSLEHQADWIVFIDDDELACEGWLGAYAIAVTKFAADAYTGPVKYIFPADYADWLANKNEDNTVDGAYKARASTNNVMISKQVISQDGFNLTFDNQMALMGGSDSDFFMRLVASGGKIAFVKEALVSEDVLPNRTSIIWRLKRQYRSSTNRVYIYIKLYGLKRTILLSLKESLRHLFDGTTGLISAPLFLVAGKNKFKRRLYHALRHYAKLGGNIFGLFGMHPQPYKTIDGY